MSDDLILRPDAKGGQTSSVSLEFIHCELADEMDLIAADPCDAWVLAWYAAYSATHFVVNQAAQAYYDDIVTKWGDKAWNDWQRCLGLPYDPGPPPEDAVHFSISTKGVSGGAGGGDSGSGLKDAQIINFGDQSILGDSSCSSIPRTVFCEPGLHLNINSLDKLKLSTDSSVTFMATEGNSPADGFAEQDWTTIQIQAYAKFDFTGPWLEFEIAPGMRYGNELVQQSRITNDAITFKYRLHGVEGAYPSPVLHLAIEARRREDDLVRTTGIMQVNAQSFSHTESEIGSLVFTKINQFFFTVGDSGVWDFYAVPVQITLSDVLGYYFADSGNLRLCADKSTAIQAMSTYTPGAAGKVIPTSPKKIIFASDVDVECKGKGVAVFWGADNHTLKPKTKYCLSMAASVSNPLSSKMTAMVANNANSSYGGYIAVRLYELESGTTGKRSIYDFNGYDGKAYLIDGHPYSDGEIVPATSWSPSSAIATIGFNYADTELSKPAVYCGNTDTVNVPGFGAVPKYAGDAVAGDTISVYVYRGAGYGLHNVPVNSILDALYNFDGHVVEFVNGDVSAYSYSTAYGDEYLARIHLTGNAASDAFVSSYIATNYGAHDGLIPRFHGMPIACLDSGLHSDSTYKIKVA